MAAKRVYACGDVARWTHPEFGLIRAEQWSNAAERGTTAATDLHFELQGLEADRRPYEPMPYFWSDHFGRRLQAVGYPAIADEVTAVKEDGDGGPCSWSTCSRVVPSRSRAIAARVQSHVAKHSCRARQTSTAYWQD